MALGRTALLAPLVRWAARLRFPVLLGLVLVLLAVNLFVPDPIPVLDEALLGLGALLLSRLRKRPDAVGPGADRAERSASR
jgi:hypothetical protein